MTWQQYLESGDPNVARAVEATEAIARGVGSGTAEALWNEWYVEFENSIELQHLPGKYVARQLAKVLIDVHRRSSTPGPPSP